MLLIDYLNIYSDDDKSVHQGSYLNEIAVKKRCKNRRRYNLLMLLKGHEKLILMINLC